MKSLLTLPAAALLAAVLSFQAPQAAACTAFSFRAGAERYLAKNHDFLVGDGLLVVNPRDRSKFSMDSEIPFRWKAQHGSVTYNQFGREFPNAGMNEAGLVVEMLWLDGTEYPPADTRPDLGVLQWVQYQLDTAGSVADVLASDERVRISDNVGKVHFFLIDRSGATAVVEWHKGRRVVYSGNDLPFAAAANDAYAACATAWHTQVQPGAPAVSELRSYDRFVGVASQPSHHASPATSAAFGFATLDRVKHPEYTRWQVVYAPASGRITVKRQADSQPAEIVFNELDFSAASKAFDLAQAGPLVWTPCTTEMNRRLVTTNYRRTPFLAHVPDETVASVVALPERFSAR
jgi:hypothetical protein